MNVRAEATGAESEPHATGSSEDGPLVSVLIVSFECRGILEACLDSLASNRSDGTEVILVDNASRDGTVELVAERYPWVNLIENTTNVGFARAVNEALDLARGRFLLLLNPDTVLPPDSLDACVAELDGRPDVGMLGCKLVRPDGRLDHACKRGFPTVGSAFYHAVGLSTLFPRSRRFAGYTAGHLGEDEVGLVDAVNGAFMLVRREAIAAVGPLDEQFFLGGEDLDWCRRFWTHGWKILYWPKVHVIHLKGGSSGGRRSWRSHYAFYHSIWLFYRKHLAQDHSAPVHGLVFVGVVAKFVLSAVWSVFGRRGASGAPPPSAGQLDRASN